MRGRSLAQPVLLSTGPTRPRQPEAPSSLSISFPQLPHTEDAFECAPVYGAPSRRAPHSGLSMAPLAENGRYGRRISLRSASARLNSTLTTDHASALSR